MLGSVGILWWVLIAAIWVAAIALTMLLASSKERNPWVWGVVAIFLPIITVFVVLLIPERAIE